MKRFAFLLPMSFVASLLLLGCGPSKKDVLGSWSGTLVLSDKALDEAQRTAKITSGGQDISKDTIKKIIESSGSSLTIMEDGTFTMTFGPAPMSGHWEFHDGQVILKMEKVIGQSPEQFGKKIQSDSFAAQAETPWTLKLSDDRKTLTGSDPTDPGSTVKLTKK